MLSLAALWPVAQHGPASVAQACMALTSHVHATLVGCPAGRRAGTQRPDAMPPPAPSGYPGPPAAGYSAADAAAAAKYGRRASPTSGECASGPPPHTHTRTPPLLAWSALPWCGASMHACLGSKPMMIVN